MITAPCVEQRATLAPLPEGWKMSRDREAEMFLRANPDVGPVANEVIESLIREFGDCWVNCTFEEDVESGNPNLILEIRVTNYDIKLEEQLAEWARLRRPPRAKPFSNLFVYNLCRA